jgi:hypothetical protein
MHVSIIVNYKHIKYQSLKKKGKKKIIISDTQVENLTIEGFTKKTK